MITLQLLVYQIIIALLEGFRVEKIWKLSESLKDNTKTSDEY